MEPVMNSRMILISCCLFLVGGGLIVAPAGVTARLRSEITDALRPAQILIRQLHLPYAATLSEADATLVAGAQRIATLQEELEFERNRNRAMQTRLAQAAEQQFTEQGISTVLTRSRRLVLPQLTDAAVLGEITAEQWRAGKLLDHGAKHGLREDELVLSPRKPLRPLIDLGAEAEISTEDAMLLGRCVIGKIEHVGRWTSTFQLVTDLRYRGRAQIIRETDSGFVFETQGILKGQGSPLCRLEGIPAEKSVRVNDAVYTAERDGILPTPLYYGQVVEAVLGPDDREWTVFVKPAPLPSHLTHVQILRTILNPERLAVK